MSEQQRIEAALALTHEAYLRLREWSDESDPIAQKRLREEAITLYQAAVSTLQGQS